MNKLLIACAASLVAMTGSAFAADLPAGRRAPPVAPPSDYSWTGCYLGGGAGYAMWNQEVQTRTDPGGVAISQEVTHGGRGWFATGQVGCDLQLGSIVIGAFGDYDWGINITGNVSVPTVGYGEEKLRWMWAAGGRGGWLPTPNLLVFFSAGFTQAQFGQVDLRNVVTNVALGQHIPAHTYSGWFLGSGYEYAIGWIPGLFWKTEYRFSDFSADTIPVLVTATGAGTGVAIHSHKYIHAVRSEVVWRFSFGGPLYARY